MSKLKLKNSSGLIRYSPTEELANDQIIAEAVWECLKNNDPQGVMEVIGAHLEAVNKLNLAKAHDIPRSTIYSALRSKNPTVSTLAKLVHHCF